ncbi:hypothetical protein CALVIDRAFT_413454 [Calocera viscosa TUFC12733]|uniref:Uncharacterized protein n=1 Tax=Calocera viscosa (strain TUFC12733) TaxID=1330018 RepID=A0A167G4H9_CALVF|nr:hypothetical protein CALVIDRAFT_413454 [Calocera viscosa TUFC12733]
MSSANIDNTVGTTRRDEELVIEVITKETIAVKASIDIDSEGIAAGANSSKEEHPLPLLESVLGDEGTCVPSEVVSAQLRLEVSNGNGTFVYEHEAGHLNESTLNGHKHGNITPVDITLGQPWCGASNSREEPELPIDEHEHSNGDRHRYGTTPGRIPFGQPLCGASNSGEEPELLPTDEHEQSKGDGDMYGTTPVGIPPGQPGPGCTNSAEEPELYAHHHDSKGDGNTTSQPINVATHKRDTKGQPVCHGTNGLDEHEPLSTHNEQRSPAKNEPGAEGHANHHKTVPDGGAPDQCSTNHNT